MNDIRVWDEVLYILALVCFGFAALGRGWVNELRLRLVAAGLFLFVLVFFINLVNSP
jgi:hypothetical protein